MQPDSLIPDPSNPQAWNRYSYVRNNPINFNDPTGHDDECVNDPICGELIEIFVKAAIATESPNGNTRARYNFFGIIKNGYYSGIGPAKVSDAEMETDYGVLVDENHRKVGLGLRDTPCDEACIAAMDQADPSIATIAMRTRLSLRLNVCVKHGCTETDMLIVAALAEDEQITPNDLNVAFRNFKSEDGLVKLDWKSYLDSLEKGRNRRKNKQLIGLFSDNVQASEDLPEIGWGYIDDLDQWDFDDYFNR